MFRKPTIKTNNDTVTFDEKFWDKYNDFVGKKKDSNIDTGVLTGNHKHYHSLSSSVTTLAKYFESLAFPVPATNQIIACLKSPFTQGDLIRTFHLIRFFQLSCQGLFITNSPIDKFNCYIKYVGAENWGNVMCYLDSLLFAMFSTLESFEPILFISNYHLNNPNRYLISQLSAMLRVYVNMMRSGNLITTDITMQLCDLMAKLGFPEAISHKQQDAAALFEFLTEVLSMPLLTFKVDIKHGGKFSKDDDVKISKERILFVSVPDVDEQLNLLKELEGINDSSEKDENSSTPSTLSNTDDSPENKISKNSPQVEPTDDILLEECLEHYFNNSISVKRELERRATLESGRKSMIPEYGIVTEANDDRDRLSYSSTAKIFGINEGIRTRSSTLSIWSNADNSNNSKEVSLPAWMFLKLLPFYTDINDVDGTARNSKEFVNRRPVLPICLKRYSFDAFKVKANRSRRRVIIPPIINLPDFVADDDDSSVDLFKLILESAVFHRGTSINLGHFVSASRKSYSNTDLSNEEATNATWYFFDDMNSKGRAIEKSFDEIFSKEWPYMLFYRLVANESEKMALGEIIPPKGFKTAYWSKEETSLAPILSAGTLPMIPDNSPVFSGQDLLNVPDNEVKRTSTTHSASSISIPDIPPSNPSFVDIRNKYFWYVTDKDKNYYKEIAEVSKDGSSRSSIAISPQFRHNSQWSFNTNVSSINDLMEENKNFDSKQVNSLEVLTQEVKADLDSKEPVEENPIEQNPPKKERHHEKHKKSSKRRDRYRKEKCVII